MTTWVIGDIHGCWLTLQALLRRISFDPAADQLWLTGDLVNRGSGSLPVLRWAFANRHCLTTVLGNHDLKLLVRAVLGPEVPAHHPFAELLAAPDRDRLLHWLRRQPLLVRSGQYLLVHAGVWPAWDLDQAVQLSEHLAGLVRTEAGLRSLYRGRAIPWHEQLTGAARDGAAAAVLTLLRLIDSENLPALDFTGSPEQAPAGWRPWYEKTRVQEQGMTVFFGHWAQLGFRRLAGAVCLDSACTWGGCLTAFQPASGRVVQEPLAAADQPPGRAVCSCSEKGNEGRA